MCVGIVWMLVGCDLNPEEVEYSNPFDPYNPVTGGDPFQMQASVIENGVELQWQRVPGSTVQGYRIYRSLTDSVNLDPLDNLEVEEFSYLDPDPPRSSVVWYRISAQYSGGESTPQPLNSLRVYTAPEILIEHDSLFTNNATVTLHIQALRAQWMWISNYPDFSDGQWQPFESDLSWELIGDDGLKTVYLQVSYDDSTLSSPINDTIILDRQTSIDWIIVDVPNRPLGLSDWVGLILSAEDTNGTAWLILRSPEGTALYPLAYLEQTAPGLFEGGLEIRWGEDASDVQIEGNFQDQAGNIADPEVSLQTVDLSLGMVEVPAGTFTMGIDNLDPTEGPAHEVYLDQYWLDRYLVTNYQYAEFLSDGNSQYYYGLPYQLIEDIGSGQFRALPGYEHLPVVMTLWHEAGAYAEWAGKRLPTEAEWEKAARGTNANIYPWGNASPQPSQANYVHSGDPWEGVLPVSITPCGYYNGRNYQGFQTTNSTGPYGNYDMAGNVWGWVSDWFDPEYYSQSPYQNPQGPDTGSVKVIRGGDCLSVTYFLRSHIRFYPYTMENRNSNVGFRCASSTHK